MNKDGFAEINFKRFAGENSTPYLCTLIAR
jgi:hypothetical protein